MATITRCYEEIELESGKVVDITVSVTGIHDAHYGADADGGRGVKRWFIVSLKHEVSCEDGELDEKDQAEVFEKIEELVYEDDWDFEEVGQFDLEYDSDEELF